MVDEKDLYTNFAKTLTTNMDCKINKKQKLSFIERLKRASLRRDYWKLREKIGSTIIGNPKFGRGILFMIPLDHMDEGQKNAFWDARKMLGYAGIRCDSCMRGCSGELELECDWSMHGAYLKCLRCGYDTRPHVIEFIKDSQKQHQRYLEGKDSDHAQAKNCKAGKCHCFDIREELGY